MQEPSNSEKKIADPDKWKPGKYKAKALDWGISETKAGLPQVTILFDYVQAGDEPGVTESRQLMWFGSFKGGARERTMETLFNLGLRGRVSSMGGGITGSVPPANPDASWSGPPALDANLECEIVVEHRINAGIKRAGISWVNQVGGSRIKHNVEMGRASQVFAEIDAEYVAGLSQKGIQVKAPTQLLAQRILEPTVGDEDMPF